MSPIEPVFDVEPTPARPKAPEAPSDFQSVIDSLGFALRACRRHAVLTAVAFSLTLMLCSSLALLWPKSYHSEVRLLAQANAVLPTLGNPERPATYDEDEPTKAVKEAILRRDNLRNLIAELGLLDAYASQRPLLWRWKDQLLGLLGRPEPSQADRLRDLVELLESRIEVRTEQDTIVLAVDWPDRATALRIVQQAEKNFLEGRFSSQMAIIGEAIGILDDEMAKRRRTMDAALAEVLAISERSARAYNQAAPSSAGANSSSAGLWPAKPLAGSFSVSPRTTRAAGLVALDQQLAAKRSAIRALEEPFQSQLTNLKRQLADLRSTLSDSHPNVVAMQKRLQVAANEPAELSRLRADERELLARMEQLAATGMAHLSPSAAAPVALGLAATHSPSAKPMSAAAGVAASPAERSAGAPADDPAGLLAARERLQRSIRSYSEVKNRADAVRLERVTEQAAFKYRYTVLKPAELAKVPSVPGNWLLLAAALPLALLTALAAAASRDLVGGRIVEPWQVEKLVGLPVLGAVRLR